MMLRSVLIIILSILLQIETGYAHARWTLNGSLTPRSSSAGIKDGPCGGIAKGNARAFQAGSSLTVQWEETINHPGRFEIYFSEANDQNFQLLKTVVDFQNDNMTPHQNATIINLPNVNCTNCTLQLIQVMTESAVPELYYSCADIQLSGAGAPASPPPGGSSNVCP